MSPRRLAVLVLAGALLLAGCSDDPEPRFEEPSESSSPSASESTSAAEPQTAEEFIREWVRLDTEMQNSGDTQLYLAASSTCSSCRNFAERVAEVYRKGGYLKTRGWRIESIEHLNGRRYRVDVRSRPSILVEEQGAAEERFEGGPARYELVLTKVDDGWQVSDWYEVAT